MDVSVDFYKRLGFAEDKAVTMDDGVRLAFLSAGTCLIELIEIKGTERGSGVVDHIAMDVDDIYAAVDNAIQNGIEIDKDSVRKTKSNIGVANVFFSGPDGERLEFFQVR